MDRTEGQDATGGSRLEVWVREHRWPLLFALLMLAVLPMRDLWAPDEPDFAQCVREMRERGTWLMPWLNGVPYDEKPILFYWAMKACAVVGEWLSGGAGFRHGISAWSLRLPSVLTAVAFVFALRRWAARFFEGGTADLAALVLASAPLWFWQSHFIQIDLLFSALLAWSWLAWLGGYLLLRGHAPERRPSEARRWFLQAYLFLGLAFLAKGPLAVVLSVMILFFFLLWQGDWKAAWQAQTPLGILVVAAVVLPWYVAAGLQGGADYAYAMIVRQNFERATRAWDHVQPFWAYVKYLGADFFPWVLLLPALAFHVAGGEARKDPRQRFLLLCFVLPFLFLSTVQSKQGKYLLPSYPALALLVAGLLRPLLGPDADAVRARRLGGVLAAALSLLALIACLVAFLPVGGETLRAQGAPLLPVVKALALVLAVGTVLAAAGALKGDGRRAVQATALTLGMVYLVGGTWGFCRLDPQKNFFAWTEAVQPLIAGRKVRFWQTIRSGAMVYTDHRMPEARDWETLERELGPEDRLVTMAREWNEDLHGLTPERRAKFEVLLRMPSGGGELLLLKWKDPKP
jgi:4-amino-4-deoxy-L-arabinose transferase-like glycosyltransferase